MPQRMSLDQLGKLLDQSREKIDAVSREVAEIQLQFVSAHQDFRTRHDAALDDLSARAAYDLSALPPDVRRAVDERLAVERKTLQERWKALTERVVPQAEQISDEALARAQKATDEMRALNPRLNQREEKLKAERAQMEAELDQLNADIKRLSGCLTVFINFFKIGELDRKRHKLLGKMEVNARELNDVRKEWADVDAVYASEQAQLGQQWQQASVDAARAREELAQLSDDGKREALALRRAIFYVFDNWKTPLPAHGQPLVDEINQMVQLNIQTDDYKEGLGKVAGLIALLGGVSQGVQSVHQSVEALINEQKMHSSYLKSVDVSVDDGVAQFHKQWDGLRGKVKDEKALGQNPAQFSALFDAEVNGWLAEANIKQMFDSLSGALTAATRGWKG